MIRATAFAVLAVWLVPPAVAQPPGQQPPPPRLLVVHAAPEPPAALSIRLLPPMIERRPGNAAVAYNKLGYLFVNSDQKFWQDLDLRLSEWGEMPLSELPRDEVRAALANWQRLFDDLDRAARMEDCDWQLPIREEKFFGLLLPEVQEARRFARFLMVRARLQAAEGDFHGAVRTIQAGLALARNVSAGPTIVNGLVGVAISQMMLRAVEDLIQQPGGPNLYWALASLPRPLIDLRGAVETEFSMIYLSYPQLRDLENADRTPAQWQAMIDELLQDISQWSDEPGLWKGRLAIALLALKGYPMAKAALIEQGRPAAEVEAMPVSQVVALYTMRTYDELRDDVFKWFYSPYPQAITGLAETEELIRGARQREIVPLASLLLPAMTQVKLAEGRCERALDLLQTIEALRMHAAAHEGRFPQRLAEIEQVPIPNDPLTGEPFGYRLEGGKAVLEAAAPPGTHVETYSVRYEIEIATSNQ